MEIILLALADSVNPCTLAIMAALLVVLLSSGGRRNAILGGILFTATVFIMYTLYGLGLMTFFTVTDTYSILKGVVFFLVLLLALWELKAFLFYKPGFSSLEMPMFLRPYAKKIIETAKNPISAIPVAVFCSIFLLPCTSGPYLAAIGMMNDISLLLLYNVVFVLPMVAITILVGIGLDPERVAEWRNKHVRYLHLLASLLLFLVALYMVPSVSLGMAESDVVLVGDPTCPHCINLKRYLEEYNIPYMEVSRSEGFRIVRELNLSWDGSVPLLIAKNMVVLGFPSKNQEVNGLFPQEEELCKRLGTPVYENNVYQYCVLKDGKILGNVNVIKKIAQSIQTP